MIVIVPHPHAGLMLLAVAVLWVVVAAYMAWVERSPHEDPEVVARREDTARHLAAVKARATLAEIKGEVPKPQTNWMKR